MPGEGGEETRQGCFLILLGRTGTPLPLGGSSAIGKNRTGGRTQNPKHTILLPTLYGGTVPML